MIYIILSVVFLIVARTSYGLSKYLAERPKPEPIPEPTPPPFYRPSPPVTKHDLLRRLDREFAERRQLIEDSQLPDDEKQFAMNASLTWYRGELDALLR